MLNPQPPTPAATVMIVEDEPNLRHTLMQMVQSLGYAVQGVASAEAARRVLGENQHDVGVVLLDLCLPGQDGMGLFEWLHNRDTDIRVVVLTGFGDLPAAQRAIQLGVVEFLTKPCYRGELERALQLAQTRRPANAWKDRVGALVDMNDTKPEDQRLDAVEYRHIVDVLHRHGGNRRAAARALGISLRSLYYRLSRYKRGDERTPA